MDRGAAVDMMITMARPQAARVTFLLGQHRHREMPHIQGAFNSISKVGAPSAASKLPSIPRGGEEEVSTSSVPFSHSEAIRQQINIHILMLAIAITTHLHIASAREPEQRQRG